MLLLLLLLLLLLAATIRVYMEKYEAPAAAAAEGEADAEPAEAVEEGADANAKLHIETSEALKDIIDAALQVSGLQVCGCTVQQLAPLLACLLSFRPSPST